MGSGLGSKFTMRVNKIVRKVKKLFQREQTYEEWLSSTNAFIKKQHNNLADSLELLHNAMNEKKEREKGLLNAAVEERNEPLRTVGQFAEYAV
ncbi:hypothetical protein Anas_02147 [Armadillidium nasatum]|uniref:Uncharacterized protein n=1 Tax=Armadillidium nasatum TaxID=96803 RepID=A0A5N5T2I3_9CRUS|nr:hypothetical protein Anas_02147 [Armadillidium nasatum]